MSERPAIISIQEVPLDDADFTIYQPYPGSPIVEHIDEYDIACHEAPQHYKGRLGAYSCSVSTSALSSDEIVAARNDLERLYRSTCSR